jgi:phenylacetate-CoA oxygenase PaaJ subunit
VGRISSDIVWQKLSQVLDPEMPISIVDMGMVYGVEVRDSVVEVRMTFTAIACPAMDMIIDDVKKAVGELPGVSDVEVDVVWNPPWTRDRISEAGREVLRSYGIAV